ncbi:hypothetical protein [Parvularcula sp. IMCC14364]|uniref:hypothetical protein n=1 Tax=Parvularcula sp. IMCC14364 TaxID=3067902 RepID=UPI0027404892|nr:hypothetical protein [Parvularcula sp. IMCC14364]
MTEADLLELAAMSRANLGFLSTQIIAVQFALIAGVFLFLNRAGILLKLGILLLYSAGYVALLGLYYWEQAAYVSVREAIQALPEQSAASAAVIEWLQGPGTNVSALVNVLFVANWFVVAFFLFAPVLEDRDK